VLRPAAAQNPASIGRVLQGCVQRHMYAPGRNRILLSKNTFLPGRIDSILEAFPDAKFVYLVRHPYEAIPSLMSLFHAIWSRYSPEIAKASPESYAVAEMGFEYYRLVLEHRTSSPRGPSSPYAMRTSSRTQEGGGAAVPMAQSAMPEALAARTCRREARATTATTAHTAIRWRSYGLTQAARLQRDQRRVRGLRLCTLSDGPSRLTGGPAPQLLVAQRFRPGAATEVQPTAKRRRRHAFARFSRVRTAPRDTSCLVDGAFAFLTNARNSLRGQHPGLRESVDFAELPVVGQTNNEVRCRDAGPPPRRPRSQSTGPATAFTSIVIVSPGAQTTTISTAFLLLSVRFGVEPWADGLKALAMARRHTYGLRRHGDGPCRQ